MAACAAVAVKREGRAPEIMSLSFLCYIILFPVTISTKCVREVVKETLARFAIFAAILLKLEKKSMI